MKVQTATRTTTNYRVTLTGSEIIELLRRVNRDVPKDASVTFEAYDRGLHEVDDNRPVIVEWSKETHS